MNNKKTRLILQIFLGVAAVVLAFFIYDSIMKPVRFNSEKDKRVAIVVERLKDIRKVQAAYKSAYGRYIGDMDSLIIFLETGRLPFVKMIGNVPDTLTETEALKMKIISRDTAYDNAYDVLFSDRTKEEHLQRLIYPVYT